MGCRIHPVYPVWIVFSWLGLLTAWKWLVTGGANADSGRPAGFLHLLPGSQAGRDTTTNVYDLVEIP